MAYINRYKYFGLCLVFIITKIKAKKEEAFHHIVCVSQWNTGVRLIGPIGIREVQMTTLILQNQIFTNQIFILLPIILGWDLTEDTKTAWGHPSVEKLEVAQRPSLFDLRK